MWLCQLLSELHVPQSEPTTLYSGNQSAIALSHDAKFHARTKHVNICHHFIHEKVNNGDINILYCPTNEMTANIFTKGLAKPKHSKFTEELGVLPA